MLKTTLFHKIIEENLHIFILQRESNIHGPDSWISNEEFFYFLHSGAELIDLHFCNLHYPLRGPVFVQGHSKWPPVMAILWQLYFDHFGNGPHCFQSEWWLTTRVTIMRRYKGPLSPSAKIFWVWIFRHFWKKINQFSKKSYSLNPYMRLIALDSSIIVLALVLNISTLSIYCYCWCRPTTGKHGKSKFFNPKLKNDTLDLANPISTLLCSTHHSSSEWSSESNWSLPVSLEFEQFPDMHLLHQCS